MSGGLYAKESEVTRFAFDTERAHHKVPVLCRLLHVSRSGFSTWSGRPRSARALADEVLTEQKRIAYVANRTPPSVSLAHVLEAKHAREHPAEHTVSSVV